MSTKIRHVPNFRDGELRRIDVDGQPVLLCKVGGKHYAVSNICPHSRVPLSEGSLRGFTVICPLHGASFDVRTGACLGGPATSGLQVYPVREEDDQLIIGD